MASSFKPYGFQYETSPRKLQPEYEPNKNPYKKKKSALTTKQTGKSKKAKRKTKYNYKPVAYIVLGFAMLFAISYRNSLINEDYNQKEALKAQVSSVQKENEQLKVSIENSLNLNSVEKSAQEKLGMQKLDNNQKVYVDLQKKDYVETPSEEVVIDDSVSWIDELMQKLMQIIK